jgi:hypothetical protein
VDESCLEGQAKKHVFGSEETVAGKDCQTLACALAINLLTKILSAAQPPLWSFIVQMENY